MVDLSGRSGSPLLGSVLEVREDFLINCSNGALVIRESTTELNKVLTPVPGKGK